MNAKPFTKPESRVICESVELRAEPHESTDRISGPMRCTIGREAVDGAFCREKGERRVLALHLAEHVRPVDEVTVNGARFVPGDNALPASIARDEGVVEAVAKVLAAGIGDVWETLLAGDREGWRDNARMLLLGKIDATEWDRPASPPIVKRDANPWDCPACRHDMGHPGSSRIGVCPKCATQLLVRTDATGNPIDLVRRDASPVPGVYSPEQLREIPNDREPSSTRIGRYSGRVADETIAEQGK